MAILSGNLMEEGTVRPPGRKVAAIPNEATAKAFFLCCVTSDNRRVVTKVFTVPPGASRKKTIPFWLLMPSNTML